MLLATMTVVAMLSASPLKTPKPKVLTRYSIVSLGSVHEARFQAVDLNNIGEVVGEIDVTPGLSKPGDSPSAPPDIKGFIWRKGRFQPLGRFPGSTWLRPNAMNDAGDIVGYAMLLGEWHCFYWHQGRIVDIGTLNTSGYRDDEEATGVNNHGVVVGHVNGPKFRNVGFQWTQKGGLTALPSNGTESSVASDVNDRGEIAGHAAIPGGFIEAVVWRKRRMERLGLLSGPDSHAIAINNRGEVVGRAAKRIKAADPKLTGTYDDHAFLWRKGRMKDLGTLPGHATSEASDINDYGDVVGTSGPSYVGPANGKVGDRICPFLWREGRMVNLNDLLPKGSGWVLTGAAAINNRGQIIGSGLHNGQPRSFLLTPTQ